MCRNDFYQVICDDLLPLIERECRERFRVVDVLGIESAAVELHSPAVECLHLRIQTE